MLKKIVVRTDTQFGTAKLLAAIPAISTWDFDTQKTMLLIGYLTSPPRYQGLNIANYWAWLRYGISIQPKGLDLRLRRLWSDVDPHQKTILADDFGMGFPCHYLIEQHGFEDFCDTKFLLSHLLTGIVSTIVTSKNGVAKSPDFIAVDSAGRLHILECKGTQSSQEYLAKAIARGVGQKNNMSNPTIFHSCMVGGIFVPQHKSKQDAEIVFADPEPDENMKKLSDLGSDVIAAGVRRVSLAKMLSTAGLWQSATAVLDGSSKSAAPSFVRNLRDNELRFSGYKLNPDIDAWEREVEYLSLEPESEDSDRLNGFTTKLKTTIPADIVELFEQSVSDEGKLARSAVDDWIKSKEESRRIELDVSYSAPNSDEKNIKKYDEVIRSVTGSWSDFQPLKSSVRIKSDLEFSGLVTSQGFGLAIKREQFQ